MKSSGQVSGLFVASAGHGDFVWLEATDQHFALPGLQPPGSYNDCCPRVLFDAEERIAGRGDPSDTRPWWLSVPYSTQVARPPIRLSKRPSQRVARSRGQAQQPQPQPRSGSGDASHSPTAQYFGLAGHDEAHAYLADPVLGPRLVECRALVAHVRGKITSEIFESPDDMQFRSCMTLPATLQPRPYEDALHKHYAGKPKPLTLELFHAS